MKNKYFTISLVTVVAALLSLLSLFTMPVSIRVGYFSGEREYTKMLDGFIWWLQVVPILLLIGVIIFSLLKIRTTVFICSIGYTIFVIATTLFILKYDTPTIGLFVILLEMIIILVGGISQFRYMLEREKEKTMIIQDTEKMLVEGEKEGNSVSKIIFSICILMGVVLFVIGCNLTDSSITREYGFVCLIMAIVILIGAIFCFMYFTGCSITVTDKRVCGKAAFSKRVDLPIDSITAVADIPLFHGIAVSTSSGRISFYLLRNSSVVYEVISKCLVGRQNVNKFQNTLDSSVKNDYSDLEKLKELLDKEVITQEDFDIKKKQILGL